MWVFCTQETESSTVQPSALPESAENNKELEHPPTQQGLRSTQSKGIQEMNTNSSYVC